MITTITVAKSILLCIFLNVSVEQNLTFAQTLTEEPIRVVVFQFRSAATLANQIESVYRDVCSILASKKRFIVLHPDSLREADKEIAFTLEPSSVVKEVAVNFNADIIVFGQGGFFSDKKYHFDIEIIPVNQARFGLIEKKIPIVTKSIQMATKEIPDKIEKSLNEWPKNSAEKPPFAVIIGGVVLVSYFHFLLHTDNHVEVKRLKRLPLPPPFP